MGNFFFKFLSQVTEHWNSKQLFNHALNMLGLKNCSVTDITKTPIPGSVAYAHPVLFALSLPHSLGTCYSTAFQPFVVPLFMCVLTYLPYWKEALFVLRSWVLIPSCWVFSHLTFCQHQCWQAGEAVWHRFSSFSEWSGVELAISLELL